MKNLLAILVFFCAAPFVYGVTYTSINDGAWNDVSTVWSLDGINPCHCAPSFTVSQDTILVKTNLSYSNIITLNNGAVLKIMSGAVLINPLQNLKINNGKLLNFGILSVAELIVMQNGSIELFSANLNIESKADIRGVFSSNFSNIHVYGGNIEIGLQGVFTITNNTKLFFISGNFNNFGDVTILDQSCIQLSSGNFKNETSGSFSGNGTVITNLGNILNEGSWDPLLIWCAAGTSTGMVVPENCTDSYANCEFAPLAAELLSFNVLTQEGSNLVNWYTYAEENGEYYLLERSSDGTNWTNLARIEARNPGAEVTHYVFIDNEPIGGISYYKLSLYTVDGEIGFSAILGVNSENQEEIIIFPNPTSDHITVRFSNPIKDVTISIVDANGLIKSSFQYDSMLEETFHLPYPCGLYFVRIDSPTFKDVIKVIKQ